MISSSAPCNSNSSQAQVTNDHTEATPGLSSSKLLCPKQLYLPNFSFSQDFRAAAATRRTPPRTAVPPNPPISTRPYAGAKPAAEAPLRGRGAEGGQGQTSSKKKNQHLPPGSCCAAPAHHPNPRLPGPLPGAAAVTHHSDAGAAMAPSGAVEGGEAGGRCPAQRGAQGRPAGGQHGRGQRGAGGGARAEGRRRGQTGRPLGAGRAGRPRRPWRRRCGVPWRRGGAALARRPRWGLPGRWSLPDRYRNQTILRWYRNLSYNNRSNTIIKALRRHKPLLSLLCVYPPPYFRTVEPQLFLTLQSSVKKRGCKLKPYHLTNNRSKTHAELGTCF